MTGEPYLYGYGRCLAPPDWNFMHMTGCNRLYVIYGGSGWYRDGDAEYRFLPDTVYLFPMKAHFQVRQLPEDPLDHLYFDFSLTPPLSSGRIAAIALRPGGELPVRTAALRELVQSLEGLVSENGAQQKGENDGVIRALFSGLLQLTCLLSGHSLSRDARVELALERIHAVELDGSLRLPDNRELAEMLHIEVNHFIRLFKREVGVTPYRYMLTHRLNVASSYIAAGGSVTEAARLVGYESVAALSHALRRRTEQERYSPPVFIPFQ